MPKSPSLNQPVEDALKGVALTDFSGMLNSELDILDLPLNAWADVSNFKIVKGKAVGRSGYQVLKALAAIADGLAFFYDSALARRLVAWVNGDIYSVDLTTYTLTLVEAGTYTAGRRIAHCVLNNILYYSDGSTIRNDGGGNTSGISYYNPVAGTFGAVYTSGTAATIQTPACYWMCAYNGALVIGNVTYSDTLVKGPDTLLWSNVLDPTTIVGTNLFKVGNGQGGVIKCVTPFRVGAEGVSPYSALFVAKTTTTYMMTGALTPGTFAEVLLSGAIGCTDGYTVQAVPKADESGRRTTQIFWLGSDRQVWSTDGISANPMTLNIQNEFRNWIADRISANANQEFGSYLDVASQHYVLDVGGNRQYCYDYFNNGWTKYNGRPDGIWAAGKDASSQDVVFMVDRANANLCQMDINTTDNGTAIAPYFKTAAIHGGDPLEDKTWHKVYGFWATDTSPLTVTATARLGQGATCTVAMQPADLAPGTFSFWDTAIWDVDLWSSSDSVDYIPMQGKARLVVRPDNAPRYLMKTSTIQLVVGQAATDTGRMEVLAVFVQYMPGGNARHAPFI